MQTSTVTVISPLAGSIVGGTATAATNWDTRSMLDEHALLRIEIASGEMLAGSSPDRYAGAVRGAFVNRWRGADRTLTEARRFTDDFAHVAH